MRRSALAVAPLLALLLVAGCDQGGDGRDFDGKGAEFGDSRTNSNANANNRANNDDNRGNTAGSLESCVVGSWKTDMDGMKAMMDPADLAQFEAQGMTFDLVFTFKQNKDYSMDMALSGQGVEQGYTYTLSGTVNFTGSWAMSGNEALNLKLTDVGGQMKVTGMGQTQTVPVTKDDFDPADFALGVASATCTASTLELKGGTDTLSLTRK